MSNLLPVAELRPLMVIFAPAPGQLGQRVIVAELPEFVPAAESGRSGRVIAAHYKLAVQRPSGAWSRLMVDAFTPIEIEVA